MVYDLTYLVKKTVPWLTQCKKYSQKKPTVPYIQYPLP